MSVLQVPGKVRASPLQAKEILWEGVVVRYNPGRSNTDKHGWQV